VVALTRRITEDLRPSSLAHLGLVTTLEILAREFSQRSGLAVHCALQPVGLGASANLVAYRLVQEAINNISKHAQARQVWLTLAPHQGRVQVMVRDDGLGFAPQRPGGEGFGLLGMRVRVRAEGGELRVQSSPGQGCCILALLPCSGPAPTLP
jgi:signal transduction histidine kinase